MYIIFQRGARKELKKTHQQQTTHPKKNHTRHLKYTGTSHEIARVKHAIPF